MNNEEAKLILSAYRPGGEDAGDAQFAEALEQIGRDPELARWFGDQRRVDAALSDALGAVPIPRDLRDNILAGGKIIRPRFWRPRPAALALAAAIVLLAGLAGVWLNRAPRLDRWQRDALAMVPLLGSAEGPFDREDRSGAVLQQWLQAQNAPAPAALPIGLQTLPSLGCKTIRSGGRAVSIICFHMPTGETVHLVVTDQENLSHPPPAQPRFVEEDGWKTASWSANGRAYMLATTASEAELHAIMARTAQASLVRPRKI